MRPHSPPQGGRRIGNGEDRPAVAPAPSANGSTGGESIEECVLRSLNEYFDNLNGAKPHPLQELVLQAVERPLLKFAMEKASGNQSAAAELLGINRNTLRKKLTDHRL